MKINREFFHKLHTTYQQIVTEAGVKAVADDLKRHPSGVYAELNIQNLETYLDTKEDFPDERPPVLNKLGLVDFLLILKKYDDFGPLDMIVREFGRVAYKMPDGSTDKKEILALVRDLNKEVMEGVNASLQAAEDNKITKAEAKKCSKELGDIIEAAAQAKATFDSVIKD